MSKRLLALIAALLLGASIGSGVLILGGRQSLLPVQVAFLLATHVLTPVRHRQSL